MALPRVWDTTLIRKVKLSHGKSKLTFRVNSANDSLKGRVEVHVLDAVAADFTVGTEYDGSFNTE